MKISNVEDFEIGFKIGLYLEEYSYAEIIEDEDAMQRVVNSINNVLSSFTHVQVDCQNSDAIYNKAVESYCDKMLKTDKNAVMYLYIGQAFGNAKIYRILKNQGIKEQTLQKLDDKILRYLKDLPMEFFFKKKEIVNIMKYADDVSNELHMVDADVYATVMYLYLTKSISTKKEVFDVISEFSHHSDLFGDNNTSEYRENDAQEEIVMNLDFEAFFSGVSIGEILQTFKFIFHPDEPDCQRMIGQINNILSDIAGYNVNLPQGSYDEMAEQVFVIISNVDKSYFYSLTTGAYFAMKMMCVHGIDVNCDQVINYITEATYWGGYIRNQRGYINLLKELWDSNLREEEQMEEIYNYLYNQSSLRSTTRISDDFYNKSYVFISYSTKNQYYADAALHLLRDEGIGAWMAPYDIPAGSKYAHVINDAIKNCSCVLLLLSEQSQASEWVEKEVERAVNYKKTIISMHLDESQLNSGFSFYLGNQQIVPVKTIDKNNTNVQKILKAIRSFTN